MLSRPQNRSPFCHSTGEWEPEALAPPQHIPDVLRLAIGRALLRVGPHWEACLLLCDTLARHFHAFVMPRFLPSALLKPWLHSVSRLLGCWQWQPVVTAREMASLLGWQGPVIGRALRFTAEWRLLRPQLSRGAVELWLARQPSLGIDKAQALMNDDDELLRVAMEINPQQLSQDEESSLCEGALDSSCYITDDCASATSSKISALSPYPPRLGAF